MLKKASMKFAAAPKDWRAPLLAITATEEIIAPSESGSPGEMRRAERVLSQNPTTMA